jgi:hypothetical protein
MDMIYLKTIGDTMGMVQIDTLHKKLKRGLMCSLHHLRKARRAKRDRVKMQIELLTGIL